MLGLARRPVIIWVLATFDLIERSRCLKYIDRALHAIIYMYKLAFDPYGVSRTAFWTEDTNQERDNFRTINLEKFELVNSIKMLYNVTPIVI